MEAGGIVATPSMKVELSFLVLIYVMFASLLEVVTEVLIILGN